MKIGALDAGELELRLHLRAGRIGAIDITSRRARLAPLLAGKSAELAVRQVPMLYSLCGKAQAQAAQLALAAAHGQTCAARLDAMVLSECLREHAWRWLLDLPPLLGLEPEKTLFLAAQRALTREDREALRALLAQPAWAELASTLLALPGQPTDGSSIGCLAGINAEQSLSLWPSLDADMAAQPLLTGGPAETGAWARRRLVGANAPAPGALAARWLARREELHDWANGRTDVGAGGTVSAVPVAPGRGRALVETARGLLMHEISLDGEQIADYVIVAPTEWNFHPQGRLANWLLGRAADDAELLRKTVALAVTALDPCVGWRLQTLRD